MEPNANTPSASRLDRAPNLSGFFDNLGRLQDKISGAIELDIRQIAQTVKDTAVGPTHPVSTSDKIAGWFTDRANLLVIGIVSVAILLFVRR